MTNAAGLRSLRSGKPEVTVPKPAALAILAIAALWPLLTAARGEEQEVDVELVLAVDVSYSMDVDEQRAQRLGYVEAIRSPEVVAAIRSGLHGRIAVSYLEWAGSYSQHLVVDWKVIEDERSAGTFADALMESELQRFFRTSISEGLIFAAGLFRDSGYEGIRKVIDISGDGPNNQGRLVEAARDEVLASGITINGLPIMIKRPTVGWYDIPNLDEYYRRCVIGGAGSFIVPVRDPAAFAEAIRRKLVLEIAGRTPPKYDPKTPGPESIRDGNRFSGRNVRKDDIPAPRFLRVQHVPREPLCTIGERLWNSRPTDWN